jgi:C4-type Zn-finger protein
MTLYCPVCTGRVRVEKVDVTIEGDTVTTIIRGVCEKCGSVCTFTKRGYLSRDIKWHTKYPKPAVLRLGGRIT